MKRFLRAAPSVLFAVFRVVYEASTLLHKIIEGPEFANDRNEMIPSMLEDSSILTLFLLK